MDRKVIAYSLVVAHNSYNLSRDVGDKLKEGYELYGSPSVSVSTALGKYGQTVVERYTQAMVKYEEICEIINSRGISHD